MMLKIKRIYNASLYFAETNGKFRYSFEANTCQKILKSTIWELISEPLFSFQETPTIEFLNPNKTFNTFKLIEFFFLNFTPTNQIQASNFNVNLNSTNKKNHYFGGGINFNPFKITIITNRVFVNRYFVNPTNVGGFLFFIKLQQQICY